METRIELILDQPNKMQSYKLKNDGFMLHGVDSFLCAMPFVSQFLVEADNDDYV